MMNSRTSGEDRHVGLLGKITMSDAYLVEQILKVNDQHAAHELISRHYKRVYKIIYLKVMNVELAEDLTQETFISVLRALNQFDEGKASFATWIGKIATNKVIDYKRGRQNKESMMTDVLMDYEEESRQNVSDDVMNSIVSGKIQEKLAQYDKDVGKIFMLRAEQGYSFAQIADIMNMNMPTVKNKYYSLVKKLRKELEGYE